MQSEISSSKVIVPLLLDCFPKTKKVLDINSGNGEWLNEFYLNKVNIAGTSHNKNNNKLLVDKSKIIYVSNILEIPQNKKYDLVMLREGYECSLDTNFIKKLTSLSNNIFFVIPFCYKSKKLNVNSFYISLFKKMSYTHYDIRSKIWYDERVSLKYKQSSFLFIKNKSRNYISNQKLSGFPLDVVHPLLFKKIYNIKNIENLNYSALEKLNETEVELNMVANRLDRVENSNSWKLIKKIQKIVNNNFILRLCYVYYLKKYKKNK